MTLNLFCWIRRRWIRKAINTLAMSLVFAAMLFGLFWLVWILWMVFERGLSAMNWQLFSEMTPPPGVAGGLKNAIVGSLILVGLAMAIATPIAVLAGIYLAEYSNRSWFGRLTRFVNEMLLSAPSITIGLFVYTLYVARVGSFSGLSGALALALLVIPVVVRTTEDMLVLVPNALREAAFALGAPRWRMVFWITLRAAKTGVVTGILLALARISGETAPLLFTAFNSRLWNTDISKPMANLPVTIFNFALSPYDDWQTLAWGGVFLITLGVLALNIFSRVLFRKP